MTAAGPAAACVPARAGVRLGPVGLAWRPRVLAATLAACALALALLVLSVAVGDTHLSLLVVVRTLLGGGSSVDQLVVVDLRLPRALVGALVGLALGVAGALTQTTTRNPLATPDVLGVTQGASAGAVVAIVLGGGSYSVAGLLAAAGIPAASAVGALLAAAAVVGLGWRGGAQSFRIVLVGIGVGAVLSALTSYLLVSAQLTQAAQASVWLVGSLSGVDWPNVWPLVGLCALAVPAALALSAGLAVGQLGDDTATGVGLPVRAHRGGVLLVAVLLTAGAVAAAGPVGFVAFVVPQLALRTTRLARPPLVLSGALGAALVLAADLAGRALFPWEVPVGLLTTVAGAPVLIWLLVRHRREMATA